jgi:protein-tyrosine phosphatase
MAEALLRETLSKRGLNVHVHSAGLAAMVGRPADVISQDLMLERRIDISGHRARQIQTAHITEADLVLVMDKQQQKQVESSVPGARGKVHSLGKWGEFDIPDPYRGSRAEFEASLALIDRGLNDWLTKAWR